MKRRRFYRVGLPDGRDREQDSNHVPNLPLLSFQPGACQVLSDQGLPMAGVEYQMALRVECAFFMFILKLAISF